jgi:hypothetical protein
MKNEIHHQGTKAPRTEKAFCSGFSWCLGALVVFSFFSQGSFE